MWLKITDTGNQAGGTGEAKWVGCVSNVVPEIVDTRIHIDIKHVEAGHGGEGNLDVERRPVEEGARS